MTMINGMDYVFNNNMNGLSFSTKVDKSMDIKWTEYNTYIDRTFISLTRRDRIQCISIFDALEECKMTQILNIPSSINQQIAMFGIGVFRDYAMCNVSMIITLGELDCRNTILCKDCIHSKQCKECGKIFKRSFSLRRHVVMKRCQNY